MIVRQYPAKATEKVERSDRGLGILFCQPSHVYGHAPRPHWQRQESNTLLTTMTHRNRQPCGFLQHEFRRLSAERKPRVASSPRRTLYGDHDKLFAKRLSVMSVVWTRTRRPVIELTAGPRVGYCLLTPSAQKQSPKLNAEPFEEEWCTV